MSTPTSRANRRTCGAAGIGKRCSVPATLPSCTGMLNTGATCCGWSGGSACSSVLPSARIAAWNARRAPCCPETCSTGALLVRAGGGAAAPPSSVKITCPTLIFSPSFTLTSLITPLTDDGTSTTALSVSNSITGWPSETLAPGVIIRRTRSPWEMFSPSSGSLNSLAPEPVEPATLELGAGGAAADGGGDGDSADPCCTGAGAAAVLGGRSGEVLASAPSTVKIT